MLTDTPLPVAERIDPRTGRAIGDHGTANQAIEFAIDWSVCDDATTFLRSWQQGDLDEWPEFYRWLKVQEAATLARAGDA